jgi:hypothetical protein
VRDYQQQLAFSVQDAAQLSERRYRLYKLSRRLDESEVVADWQKLSRQSAALRKSYGLRRAKRRG